MILSEMGQIAEQEWTKTPQIRPDRNIEMDASVVMPNHIHGIIIIGENDNNRVYDTIDNRNNRRGAAMHRVSTTHSTRIPNKIKTDTESDKFAMQSKNLASIIRGFKPAVATYASKNTIDFSWQSRFYDHITRDEDELNRIWEYILNNLQNWQKYENNRIMDDVMRITTGENDSRQPLRH